MIIWLVLFVIIIAVSFILAYLSMRDFQEVPEKKLRYSVFLIQNPGVLTEGLLSELHKLIKKGEIISLERLFKGNESALVIFGPKEILQQFNDLHLLELEDYTAVNSDQVVAWELTVRDHQQLHGNLFTQVPEFEHDEQFWWQIILQTYSKNYLSEFIDTLRGIKSSNKVSFLLRNETKSLTKELHSLRNQNSAFQTQIRAVLVAPTDERRRKLKVLLENIGNGLIKIPRPYSSSQILEFYTTRNFTPASFGVSILSPAEILSLIGKG